MELLSAAQVQNNHNRKETAQRERVQKINREESESVRRLNIALEEEKIAKDRIATDLLKAEEEAEAKKTALLQEVVTLEQRKEEALKPVGEILARAKATEEKNTKEEGRLVILGTALKEEQETIFARSEEVSDREQLANERHSDLDKREKLVLASEEENKRSSEKLAEKWVAFHKTVHTQNESMARREKVVTDKLKVIDFRNRQLEVRQKEQDERERQLRDRSATLERTALELLSKQQKQ